jgi:hypothetical protein
LLEKDGAGSERSLGEWAELIERRHVELGVMVADGWKLPPLVRDAISAHHGAVGARPEAGLLEVVKASDRVLSRLGVNLDLAKADLESLQALAPTEREAVARVVEKIPEFVAAFEAPEPRSDPARSLVTASAKALGPGERVARFEVTVTVARRARRFTAVAIGPDRLAMLGKEPLPESRLLEAQIHRAGKSLPIWVLTRSSRTEGDAFHVEVQPYALSRETRGAWEELIAAGVDGD